MQSSLLAVVLLASGALAQLGQQQQPRTVNLQGLQNIPGVPSGLNNMISGLVNNGIARRQAAQSGQPRRPFSLDDLGPIGGILRGVSSMNLASIAQMIPGVSEMMTAAGSGQPMTQEMRWQIGDRWLALGSRLMPSMRNVFNDIKTTRLSHRLQRQQMAQQSQNMNNNLVKTFSDMGNSWFPGLGNTIQTMRNRFGNSYDQSRRYRNRN